MKLSEKQSEEIVRAKEIKSDGAEYKYTLFVRTSRRVASFCLPLYSVRIEMKTKDGRYTEARTADIFSDLGKATVFFERLAENLATPINLAYIVEDAITP